jgi:hypothetical protein
MKIGWGKQSRGAKKREKDASEQAAQGGPVKGLCAEHRQPGDGTEHYRQRDKP